MAPSRWPRSLATYACVLALTACAGSPAVTATLAASSVTTASPSPPAGPSTSTSTAPDPPPRDTISAGAQLRDAMLTDTEKGALNGWRGAPAMMDSAVDVLRTHADPQAPLTITRNFRGPVPEGVAASFVYFDAASSTWVAAHSALSTDRRTLTAQVTTGRVWAVVVSGSVEQLEAARTTALSGAQLAWAVTKSVGGVRVEPPECLEAPSWVRTVRFTPEVATDAPLLGCVEATAGTSSSAQLNLKVKVNRGYGFVAIGGSPGISPVRPAGASDHVDDVLASLAKVSSTLAAILDEPGEGMTVRPGQEVWAMPSQQALSTQPGTPVLRLRRQATIPFVVGTLAQLISDQTADLTDALLTAATAVGSCVGAMRDLRPTDVDPDAVGAALGACHQATSDSTVQKLAELLMRRPGRKMLIAEAKKAARQSLGKLSLYLALAGPTLKATDYFVDARNGLGVVDVAVAVS